MRNPAFAQGHSAAILRLARTGLSDAAIARSAGCTEAHVAEIRRRYGQPGEVALTISISEEAHQALLSACQGSPFAVLGMIRDAAHGLANQIREGGA